MRPSFVEESNKVSFLVDDTIKDTVWILGIIDAEDKEIFFVPNRKVATLSRILEERIMVESTLVSDGYPSYPGFAENLSFRHIFVFHSEGFTDEEGEHTNNIENLWSYMKSDMYKQHGVARENIDIWLEKFMFIKKNFKWKF